MANKDDRYLMPFALGNELTSESFKLTQNDNTYTLASPRYYQFYASYLRPRTAMYRGWIEGFHNLENGTIPTLFLQKIGTGIVSTLFGKPMILNANDAEADAICQNQYKKSNFNAAVKEAYGFALDGGTSLLKWNRDGKNQLRAEALPVDKFFINVDAYGDIESVRAFIATYHDTIQANEEYYLCEERFFRYASVGGEQKRFPMVHYVVYKTSSNVASENTPTVNDAIKWGEIPWEVRNLIRRDYGEITTDIADSQNLEFVKASEFGRKKTDKSDYRYDRCTLLPFDDDLGCRLIKFTRNIPAFPKLPFGQPLADLLMNENYAYDQLKFFERLEVYISRGRIMIDKRYGNPNDPDSKRNMLDSMIFTYYDTIAGESDDKEPKALQPELRAEAINRQKQNILNDTAFSLNLSATTIASWLSDGQTQKTATEIEYERTKTSAFINDKIEIIQEPLQEMIDLFFHYYGASSPELNIMPENQAVQSERIQMMSELYDKGQVTAKMLAKEILGTSSTKEINELVEFIQGKEQERQAQQMMMPVPQQIEGGNQQ